jgi:hypothetical protein
MIKTSQFNRHLQNIALKKTGFFTLIGHSRLVTDGYENFNYNNQPIVKKDVVGMQNGIRLT